MKYISLFAGCGGFDLGLIGHGFSPIAAYDCDCDAVLNYRANIDGSVHCVDLREGLPNGKQATNVDVLIAGPPCQGFSTAGKRLVDDERNQLLPLTGALARQVQPKVMVVENVAGALSGAHAKYWMELNEGMRSAGYKTHTMVCQTVDIGMAQLRKRVLLFAWRTGNEIRFEPEVKPAGMLKDVLGGLRGVANHEPRPLKRDSTEWKIAQHVKQGQKLSNVRGGANAVAAWDIPEVFGAITADERTVLELLRRLRRQERQRDCGDADPVSMGRLESALGMRFKALVNSLISKGYVKKVDGGVDLVGTFNGKYRRMAWNEPSSTVDTRFGSPRYFLHPTQQRGFSVREAARIQGFCDSYKFLGSEMAQYRLIGNAVPPPLGAHAAKFIGQLLGHNG